MTYDPTHLKRWTMPDHYFGEVWPAYYSSGCGQSRDSDALERSNFTCMLRELGGETETVIVVNESHWAVGWVEWIAIHQDDEKALRIADKIKGKLSLDYPVVDENPLVRRRAGGRRPYLEELLRRRRAHRLHPRAPEPVRLP